MTKQELRQKIRQAKKQHTTIQLQAFSQSITQSLLERIHQWKHERERELQLNTEHKCCILLYHSLPDEVDTHDLIRTLHAEGHTILLPSVEGNDLHLHIYKGDHKLDVSKNYGIQESRGPLFTNYALIDLAIIPGMAFTQEGARLGRGKGYYDRLLQHLHCRLIGIAFPFQILPYIPTEPHDIAMTEVVC